MRRFATRSIAMLVATMIAPACAAVLGIDTDRELMPIDAGTTPEATITTPIDSGATPVDASTDRDATIKPDPHCDPSQCLAPLSCNPKTGYCDRDCNTVGDCADTVTCVPGQECWINCKGKGCDNVHCTGGESCTFDCTNADCQNAICDSPLCDFRCMGDKCASSNAGCSAGVQGCTLWCETPDGGHADCAKGLRCCSDGNTTCPPNSQCDHGGGDDDNSGHQ